MTANRIAVIRATLNCKNQDELIHELSPLLSKRGLFLKTSTTRPIGSEIHFEFKLVDSDVCYSGMGFVREELPPRPGFVAYEPGMLIALQRINKPFKALVDAILDIKHDEEQQQHELNAQHIVESRDGNKRSFDIFGELDLDSGLDSLFAGIGKKNQRVRSFDDMTIVSGVFDFPDELIQDDYVSFDAPLEANPPKVQSFAFDPLIQEEALDFDDNVAPSEARELDEDKRSTGEYTAATWLIESERAEQAFERESEASVNHLRAIDELDALAEQIHTRETYNVHGSLEQIRDFDDEEEVARLIAASGLASAQTKSDEGDGVPDAFDNELALQYNSHGSLELHRSDTATKEASGEVPQGPSQGLSAATLIGMLSREQEETPTQELSGEAQASAFSSLDDDGDYQEATQIQSFENIQAAHFAAATSEPEPSNSAFADVQALVTQSIEELFESRARSAKHSEEDFYEDAFEGDGQISAESLFDSPQADGDRRAQGEGLAADAATQAQTQAQDAFALPPELYEDLSASAEDNAKTRVVHQSELLPSVERSAQFERSQRSSNQVERVQRGYSEHSNPLIANLTDGDPDDASTLLKESQAEILSDLHEQPTSKAKFKDKVRESSASELFAALRQDILSGDVQPNEEKRHLTHKQVGLTEARPKQEPSELKLASSEFLAVNPDGDDAKNNEELSLDDLAKLDEPAKTGDYLGRINLSQGMPRRKERKTFEEDHANMPSRKGGFFDKIFKK